MFRLLYYSLVSDVVVVEERRKKYEGWEIVEIAKENINNITEEIKILKELNTGEDQENKGLLIIKEKRFMKVKTFN